MSILFIIVLFALIILFHEFGHFIAAKWARTRVEEFGIGFPPRLFGKQFGETLYSVNLLPLGGFVKIFGEDDGNPEDPCNFASKPIWVRAGIIAAGVFMNIFFAFLLYTGGHMVGLPTTIESDELAARAHDVRVQIIEVAQDSPASLGGLQPGDTIVELRAGEETLPIVRTQDVREFVSRHTAEVIALEIARGSERQEIAVTPRSDPPAGQGALGIAMLRTGIVSYPIWEAPLRGAETTFATLRALIDGFGMMFGRLFAGDGLAGDVTGPVGIARMAGDIGGLGLIYLIPFAAFLSLNIALLNVVPFPALDGGRLFFLLIEFVKRSPVDRRVERVVHMVGFAILLLMMLAITFRDVEKLL